MMDIKVNENNRVILVPKGKGIFPFGTGKRRTCCLFWFSSSAGVAKNILYKFLKRWRFDFVGGSQKHTHMYVTNRRHETHSPESH